MGNVATGQRRWANAAAVVALLAIVGGAIVSRTGDVWLAAVAWRFAFFAMLGAIAFRFDLIRGLLSGRLHTQSDVRRDVPFSNDELKLNAFNPGIERLGLRGRIAAVGLLTLLLALMVWCGGLGFGALSATGTMDLTTSAPSHVVERDGSGAPMVLEHGHLLVAVDDAGTRADVRVEHPTTRAQAVYSLGPGESVLFEGHRISAVEVSPLGVTLRFAERWVWWWRVSVVGIAALGFLCVLLVPYRAWAWMGRNGDYQLRAWSFNAPSTTGEFVASALRDSLGEQGYAELTQIEKALDTDAAPASPKAHARFADPLVVLRLIVVPGAALLGLAHEFVAAAPGTGVAPLSLGVALLVLAMTDLRRI